MSLRELVERLVPGIRVESIRAFGTDADESDTSFKAQGYGEPLLIRARDSQGIPQAFVFHTVKSDRFGHDRRSDRAQQMLLGFDTFRYIPRHAAALDVGAIRKDDSGLISLAEGGEFYLITRYAEGHVYAEELREVARRRGLTETDRGRARELAEYLAALHQRAVEVPSPKIAYERALRDVVGSGEGIFGIIDSYPTEDRALESRLRSIEQRAVRIRADLRPRADRLRWIHGDFHPFNLLFDGERGLTLLDASRGCLGDPADDVICLAINYVFFALDHPGAWAGGFRDLWQEFWSTYMTRRSDPELLSSAPLYWAWRGLVLANPVWYSKLSPDARERLIASIDRALDAPRFELDSAEEIFR